MGTKGEGNRRRIIEAAESLFYRCGYNQTSFQDISDATDIPRGNFYYYFKTKEEILNAVIDERVAELSRLLVKFDIEISDPRERLIMFIGRLISDSDNIMESGCPAGSLSTELAKGDIALHEKSKLAFIVLCDWVTTQFEKMGIEHPNHMAMDLVSRLQGINIMANVFKDVEYLKRSHDEIKQWVQQCS